MICAKASAPDVHGADVLQGGKLRGLEVTEVLVGVHVVQPALDVGHRPAVPAGSGPTGHALLLLLLYLNVLRIYLL
jgi:hypothetical protein